MPSDDEVVSANSTVCPAGKNGIVTTKIYKNGRIKYHCSAGGPAMGLSSKPCLVEGNEGRVASACRSL